MKIPLLLIAVLGLAGCGGSTPFVKSADPCKDPVALPERWLNDREIELLWSADRQELKDCALKVEALSGRAPKI